MLEFFIRLAELNDIPRLEDVERSAATAFLTLPDYAPSGRTVPVELLSDMVCKQKLWVAITNVNGPIGFVGCSDLGNMAYIHEISVAHAFQKKGVGRKLMMTAVNEAASRGYAAIGLTTRRDAAWNMPFYKTLGFCEITDAQEYPELWAQLQNEISTGSAAAIRCAMVKKLTTSS